MCRDNELGYMYFYNLGGKGTQRLGNQGPIRDIQRAYWSGTESPGGAWVFTFNYGGMVEELKAFGDAVWAVRPGDVAKWSAQRRCPTMSKPLISRILRRGNYSEAP